MSKKWLIKEQNPGFDYSLYKKFGINKVVSQILFNKGFIKDDEINNFLNPSLKTIYEPELLPNMSDVSKRVGHAIKNGETILLFGDYDVDGITGTSILYHFLDKMGAKVLPYIPNRFTDGYGISAAPLDRIVTEYGKPGVVISIDNGVVAFEASEYLQSSKIDFVVADHHKMADTGELPEAMIVHPGIPGSDYPNKHLCGAGVAFKVAWGLARSLSGTKTLDSDLKALFVELTSLVAMGTIADIMPLTGENRTLVSYGLKQLKNTSFPGVRELVRSAKIKSDLKAGNVAYHIAPRINASGRLGSGDRALKLLTSYDLEFSSQIAKELGKENERRREIEAEIVEKAFSQVVEIYGEQPKRAALVLAGEDWHEGVVGIVASRVTETFSRPALVLSILEDGILAKGSGRTALGVDMKSALDECKDLLLKYGGHEAAVGLSLKKDEIEELRERFALVCARQLGYDNVDLENVSENLKIENEISLKEISEVFIEELNKLEPCGMGNKKPIFCSRVKLAGEPSHLGKEKNHLTFKVDGDGNIIKCVMWKRGDLYAPLYEFSRRPMSGYFKIAFKPEINDFMGKRYVQLNIQDFQIPEEEEL